MEIKVPVLGENVDSATVVKILVKVGETISQDQPIVEIETEKASVDIPSPNAGTISGIQVTEGATVTVGQTILTIEEAGENKELAPAPKDETETPKPIPPPKAASAEKLEKESEGKAEKEQDEPPRVEAVAAAPSLRRMARELGIDIHAVKGTGGSGRITEDDVRGHARSIILNARGSGPSAVAAPLPDFSRWGDTERKELSPIRRKTAEHVQNAWSTIPHVTQFDSADITELEKARKTFSKQMEAAGGKLTITAIALKCAAAALKLYPQVNASIDPGLEDVILKKYCNIGVAVDTEHGLLVPVIRDVDKKNILNLSVELTQLAEKARNKKLAIDDMQGGTFTITNLGGIGGSHFTPIVNAPEVAILGISRATVLPVFIDGAFTPRLMLPLSLSYDHRAIDGADGARFLRWIAAAIEQPFMLSLIG